MNKKEAIDDLKLTGWFFRIIGIMSLISVILYWGEKVTIDSIFDFLFGAGMIYFSHLILSSVRVLDEETL